MYFKEKHLFRIHSDSVYLFPIQNDYGTLEQTVAEAGLKGLCERLLNIHSALDDMKIDVKNSG